MLHTKPDLYNSAQELLTFLESIFIKVSDFVGKRDEKYLFIQSK